MLIKRWERKIRGGNGHSFKSVGSTKERALLGHWARRPRGKMPL